MTHPHSEEINQLLEKLKSAHEWLMRHQNDEGVAVIEGLLNRTGPIVDRLENLGIDRQTATELLMFDTPIRAKK